MTGKIQFLSLLLAIWVQSAVSGVTGRPPVVASTDTNTAVNGTELFLAVRAAVSESNFAFLNALHEQLRSSGGQNSVFSPVSISLSLLLAKSGACCCATTAAEIDTVLRVPAEFRGDQCTIEDGVKEFLAGLRDCAGHYNVTVLTKTYANKGLEIYPEYDAFTEYHFGVTVEHLGFEDGQGAAKTINSWVERETDGKFPQLVSSDALNRNTSLVLINAMHFKSPWEYKFEANRTRKQVFHLNSTATTEVDMMASSNRYSYAELPELGVQLVVMPYKGGRFSLQVFIPNDIDGLEDFLRALQSTELNEILRKIRKTDHCDSLHLRLPKFKIESTLNLVGPLKQMGAQAMFSATDADLSEMSQNAGVHVSEVIQKAYIEVNEEGTEAAAATANRTDMACEGKTMEMTANRPFYYQIIDEHYLVIMLAGIVKDPNA